MADREVNTLRDAVDLLNEQAAQQRRERGVGYDAPPRNRLRLLLDVSADDLENLANALLTIAFDLEIDGREVREVDSGGYASSYHLELSCNPEQTGVRYREQLMAWSDRRRGVDRG